MEVIKMAVDWNYYDKFEELIDKYMPISGEGKTKATQIVTAVNKLVYKWYNDGDVYDNSYVLEGWVNDLSDYANWLWEHTEADEILDKVFKCYNNEQYEDLLKELADKLFIEEYLEKENEIEKIGTIYDCEGKFQFVEFEEEEEEEEYDEDDYDEEEDYDEDEEEY